MRPEPPAARQATAADHVKVASTLANAFAHDPLLSWIVRLDNIESRLSHLFNHTVGTELAKPTQMTWVSNDCGAAAVWHEVDEWKTSNLELLRAVPAVVRTFRHRLPRALGTLSTIEKIHPPDPHFHLAFIGVRQELQGQGRGGALPRAVTERCDREGVGAYLESSNPRNDPLYARHGFEATGTVPLASGAPVVTTMWRKPR